MVARKMKFGEMKNRDRNYEKNHNRYMDNEVPKFTFPRSGIRARAAYQLIHDELNLDGNPDLNLATFVTTWMEPEADRLIIENLHKNFIDHFEYPQVNVIEERIVNILANLYNVPERDNFIGTSTIGSSEAIMLGLLAHKWNWKQRRIKENEPHDRPNIVFGGDTHVSWDKFAKYFDVEPRIVPLKKDRFVIGPDDVRKKIDENTIAVGAVLGTTFTGEFDPVTELNDMLLDVKNDLGLDIPIHVDAASAGFITPFYEPDFKWDFRLEQVKSINSSGHKFGLVYPGLGWLIFRNESLLPEDLKFYVNYLGDEMPTYTLNFSEGSSMIVAQYYNIMKLGFDGYSAIVNKMMGNAHYLAESIAKLGSFEPLNDARHIPVVTFKQKEKKKFTLFDLSYKLRERGWIVPAYSLPPEANDTTIMRVVVRENFTSDMIDIFVQDLMNAEKTLENGNQSQTKAYSRNAHSVS
ncbi:MAG: glutamate decarboxylase [Thermoplasmatales archaeon]|nr:glutamate decarboxylase [Thermoplasmatales archaeon]MCW6170117.1 glutamate decarboxylase [Thermoplasmatales archaeon]